MTVTKPTLYIGNTLAKLNEIGKGLVSKDLFTIAWTSSVSISTMFSRSLAEHTYLQHDLFFQCHNLLTGKFISIANTSLTHRWWPDGGKNQIFFPIDDLCS